MSGLFRYNTNSIRSPGVNSGPASSSTPNNSSLSPFKMTPPLGLFGKNTPGPNWMNNAESPHSFNMSSGGGSPDKLKSVNEMERRLDNLEKENFNLRMKLFYHQESWANSKSDEAMAKEIVELKVQIATQQDTIKEKTDAVVKASKALNFMEACLAKNEKELGCLKARIAELEGCMSMQTTGSNRDGLTSIAGGKSIDCLASPEGNHLHDSCRDDLTENPMLRTLEKENGCLKGEVERLQEVVKDMMNQMDQLMAADAIGCLDKSSDKTMANEELRKRQEECEMELCQARKDLQGTAKNLECAKAQLLEAKKRGADLICENEELTEKLKKSETGLRNATRIVEKMMGKNGGGVNNCKLSPFENDDAFSTSAPAGLVMAGGDCDALAVEMRRIIREKNTAMCEQRTAMLNEGKSMQCIDKELEGKCEEIKRLSKVLGAHEEQQKQVKGGGGGGGNQSWSSAKTAKTCDMTTLSNVSSAGLVEVSSGLAVKRLEEELDCHRKLVDEAEQRTQQMTEVVTVLRLRLEELAGFLKTLLQHKDILGFLCRERVTAIEKAVDRSLNLTNSMDVTCSNMTLGDITNVSKLFGDFSLNVAAMDQTAAAELNCSGPGQDPLDVSSVQAVVVAQASANTVDALRNEILTLRGELEKAYKRREGDGRKNERRSMPCRGLSNNSDSEWSQPDLDVSAQRIGIEVAKDRAILISSSDEEIVDLACASSSSAKRSIMEKMLKYEREIEVRDNRVLEVKLAMVELEAQLKQEQVNGAEVCRNLAQCKEMNCALDRQVGELKRQLSDALLDLDLARSQLKCEAEKHEKEVVERLARQKDEWQRKVEELRRKMQGDVDGRVKEVEEQKRATEQQEREVSGLRVRLAEVQTQLEKVKEKEAQWVKDIMAGEEKGKKLRKTLDELTIQATRAAVERTKAVNDRDKAVLERKELEAKYDCLLEERIKLKDRLYDTDRLNTELCTQLKNQVKAVKECDATSGYGSEETRPSSPEHKAVVVGKERCVAVAGGSASAGEHDCDQVECENQELKRRLAHLKRTLEHTFNKLKMSNQMKEKVERDIQQQLIKTNNVLKIARGNIENRQS